MDAKKKKNLEETYERILNVGFCLIPYEDLSDIIAPEPMVYGTAKDERILSFEGVEALFKAQFEQVGDMKPSLDRKRITLRISNNGNQAIIVEEITLTLSSPEVTHTIFMRASCVMEYLDNRWKLTHWHTSTPVETENDPWHMEEWKREKEKLQQLVDEQTAALKQNNRELQIEAALEKVRSSSLAMQKTEDLREVVKVLFEQMQWLSVDMGFASVSIFIFEDGSRNITQWLPLPDGVSSLRIPYFEHPISSDLFDAKESGEDFFTKIYTLKEKNTWLKHGFEHTDYKDLTEEFKSSLLQAPGYAIAITLAKNSGICIPSFEGKLPTSKNIQIMKRVGKVFEQAYIRFLDLQKAESQAREAQIEVAVERVRAKALAMHKSTEILQVAMTLKEQMEGLNLSGITAATIYLEHVDNKIRVWDITELKESEQGPQLNSDFTFRLEDTDPGLWVRRVWNANEKYSVIEMSGDDFIKCEKWIREFDETAADNYREFIRAAKVEHTWHPTVQLEKGKLNLDFTVPPPVEMEFILPKMGAAFDLAYRRFLDLEKAEAQAKEAKIEAALERVRSRSLAMHHSSELSAVVDTLLGEFTNLEFTLTFCIINLIDEQDMSNTVWAANPETGKDPESYYMKFEDYPFHHAMWDAWKAQKKRFVYTLEGEEKKLYDEYLYNDTEFRRFPKHIQEANKALERYVARFTFFKYSGLQTVSVNPISEDELEILERFGRVFEQAYTRFLDLKKAEAQAREAQIETALEKVRSRSMAMHNSQELKEVALELRKQMGLLGQKDLEVCAIHLYGNDEDSFESWSAMKASDSETEIVQTQAHFPKRGIRIVDEMVHHYTIGTKDYVLVNEREKIAEWFKVLKKHAPELHASILDSIGKVPVKQLKANWAVADFSGGALVMVTYGETDEVSRNLLRRSANVFEQAYVRFLDLQKAENQVRESQIEASLERVRSKALAMHNTEDLRQTITSIFEELKGLNIKTIRLGLGLVNPDSPEGEIVTSRIDEKDQILEVSGKFRLEGHPVLDSIYDHFKQQQDHFPILEGEEINSYYTALQGSVNVQGQGTDTKHFGCFLYFKEGCLYAWSAEPHSEGQIDILKKFSRVVEITYRRYIELQKAEEQAKEAQIEASLERIRAKAMAMHQSDELDEVLAVLCEQFDTLGIFPMSTHMTVLDIANNKFTFRETGKFGNRSFGEQTVALDAMDTWKDMVESWKSAEPYSINSLHFPKETLPQVWEVFHESFASMPEGSKITPDDYPDGIYHTAGKHPFGYIGMNQVRPATEKEEQIVIKFANEFGRAYQRFLDLQKAEAQAREAQIVASMERVRAATMAMHQSNELSLVLSKLFEQFDVLGIKPSHAVLTLIDKEKNTMNFRTTGKNGYQVLAEQEVDLNVMNAWVDTAEKWKKSNPNAVNVNEFPPEILPEVWEVYKDILASMPKKARPEIKDFPDGLFITEGYCRFGYIGFAHHRKPTEEEKDIVRRIAAEFGTLYQRFLDLKKSEAQAREAQIETALEKVRSRTMAMQKGDELQEVAVLLYKELIALGVTNFVTCGYVEVNEAIQRQHTWVTSPGGDTMGLFHLPLTGDDTFDARYAAWKNQETVFHQSVAGQIRSDHLEYAITTFNSKEAEEMVRSQFPDPTVFYCFNFSHGYLHLVGGSLLEKEEELLLARFTKVFEQTYTRFLDLQKAEAQAREAQVEVALEKVRSRTMGMQSSDELPEVANMLFLEVQALGINAWSCGYNILNEDLTTATCAMSSEGTLQTPFQLRLWGEASFDEMGEFINNNKEMLVQVLGGEALVSHYTYMKSFPDLKPTFDEIERLGLSLPTYQINHLCKFSHGFLLFITYEKVPDAHDIFKRFTKVFDQTYTRFLDLQKAEARAREAQIQTALERVRSHSMGMQSTLDFANVTTEMFNQLRSFGEDLFATGIVFCDKHEGHVEQWHSIPGAGMLSPMIVPIDLDYIHQYRYDQWKAGNPLFSIEIPSDFIEQHFEDIFKLPSAQITIKDLESRNAPMPAPPPWEIDYGASFKHGYILVSSLKPIENMDILPRFAQVFEQAYIRFLDLQKAEAQAREAQIENALEKVRSRSLAMQSPAEIIEVAQLLREEMGALGVEALETSSIYIHDKENDTTQCWFTIKNEKDGKSVSDQMTIDLKATWVGRKMHSFYKSSSPSTSIVMTGKHRVEWIQYCEKQSTHFSTSKFYGDTIPTRTYHLNKFSDGFIGAAAPGDISEESWDLLKRATAVFSFAYTRFRDLQKAEMRAREAQIEMALEKVRSRTMTMAHSSELADTSVIVFKELLNLGIAPNRLFIGIIKDKGKAIEAWATNEDGSKIEKHFQLHPAENKSIQKMVDAWKQEKKSAIIDMSGKELQDYFHYLNTVMQIPFIHGLQQKRRVQTIAYFSGGLIGMAAPEEQPQQTIDLLERFAAVFNLTYTRFNDLKIAEKQALQAEKDLIAIKQARQKAEEALKELQATQTQLVQQEKLASLGQLTAGIAHEIKNPLNFVNNFSEVSNELIDEVFEELEKLEDSDVKDDIKAILDDVKGNLSKVHEHGTRADSIVKSMLQHSRGGSGKMEATDLNALIKEYTNLSFHGMRAKKNPINVEIDLQLDPNIETVSLIGEDFSRVILNLTNNAFDAMRETVDHRPAKLTVRTKQQTNAIVIEVEDNGPGIPDAIKDKILQPFFTTKKGTEGTGLGLSITNDIIKAHRGELKILTKEDAGTVFVIHLPR